MIGQTNEKILSKQFQRELRTTMTDVEQALWKVLRGRQYSGHKFRRQHPFADYILDFVCLSNKLVIELDGGQHTSQREYDEIRTKRLQSAGFHVLRFWNIEVIEEFEAVKDKIWMTIEELEDRPHPHPSLPLEGEGTKGDNGFVFPPPFQGEGRGGDGVDCGISANGKNPIQPHPHPNLPLEGEGTRGKALALIATISILFIILLFTGTAATAAEVEPPPKLSLLLSLGKNEAFPGEAVPVIVTLRVYDATVRNIGYPRLVAPAGGTVSFASPTQETDTNDTNTSLYKFNGYISSAKSGTLIVGPATLDCEAMETAKGSAAFFGGQKPHLEKVTSSTSTLVLLPLPSAGKPAHFSGAIGAFSLSVKSLPAQVVIGEPVTVVTTIKGTGSLDDASCPTIVDPSIQSFPVRAMRSASQLVCEQVVVPNKVMAIPSVTWSYFDPVARQYLVLKGDVSSKVIAQLPAKVSQTASSSSSVVVSSQNQSPAAFSRLMLAGTASVFVVLIVALVIFLRRNKQELETTVPDISVDMQGRLQAAEDAVSKGDVELFYNIAFEIVQSVEKSHQVGPLSIKK